MVKVIFALNFKSVSVDDMTSVMSLQDKSYKCFFLQKVSTELRH